jgi:hypothetical protein
MSRHSSYSISRDFEVFAEVGKTSEYITLMASADYDVESDDPAYDPYSGNSLTTQWCPTTSVELEDVRVTWATDTDDLDNILKEHGIAGDFTLHFSYDADDMYGKDGEDNRSILKVTPEAAPDLLTILKADIHDIVWNFADSIEIDPDDP